MQQLAGYDLIVTSRRSYWLFKGLRRKMIWPVKQAKAMTPAMLKKICGILDVTDIQEVVTYTLYVVGFFLFLRASNLTPKSREFFDPSKHFTRANIHLTQEAVVADIKYSKVIQFQERLLQVPLLPVADENICPVYWVRKMIELVPAWPQDPLFSVPVNGRNLSISY